MKSYKITFLLVLFAAVLLSSCSKNEENSREDSLILVKVVGDDGKIVPDETVGLYDEETYKLFEKNNLIKPNESRVTNSSGVVSFSLDYNQWFKSSQSRMIRFVVQYGGGANNYQIWTVGKLISPGQTLDLEIKLTN